MSTKRENQEKPTTKLHGASVPINRLGDAQKLMGAQQQAVSKLLDTIKGACNEYIVWKKEFNDNDLIELRIKNFIKLVREAEPTLESIQLWDGAKWITMPLTKKAAGLPVIEVEDTSKAPSKPTKTKQTKKQQKSPLTVHCTQMAKQKYKKIMNTTKGLDYKTKYGVEIMLLAQNCFKTTYNEHQTKGGDLGSLSLFWADIIKYVKNYKHYNTKLKSGWKDDLLKSLIDDGWILGRKDKALTVKPFSKGIEGWKTGDKLHPTVIGKAPIRITRFMKL